MTKNDRLAERVGFEPTVRLRAQRFSSSSVLFLSLIEVPDIVLNLPLVPRLLPNGDVFACKWLRIIAGGLASEFANFAQVIVAKGFDVDDSSHSFDGTA